MATGKRIYILTQDGVIQGATESSKFAEHWLGLGDLYDYVPTNLNEISGEGQAPAPASEASEKVLQQLEQSGQRADEVQRSIEHTKKKYFTPKSSLLNPR